MKSVRFLEEAQEEFLDQISYYEEQQKGLGGQFREAVVAAIALASAHAKLGSMEASNATYLSEGFPVFRGVPS